MNMCIAVITALTLGWGFATASRKSQADLWNDCVAKAEKAATTFQKRKELNRCHRCYLPPTSEDRSGCDD